MFWFLSFCRLVDRIKQTMRSTVNRKLGKLINVVFGLCYIIDFGNLKLIERLYRVCPSLLLGYFEPALLLFLSPFFFLFLFFFFFFSLARRYSIGTQPIVGLNIESNQRTEAEKVYRCSFCSWTQGSGVTLVILLLPSYRPHFGHLRVLLHQSHSINSILARHYSAKCCHHSTFVKMKQSPSVNFNQIPSTIDHRPSSIRNDPETWN